MKVQGFLLSCIIALAVAKAESTTAAKPATHIDVDALKPELGESFAMKTENQRLMNIIVNSLYTTREVFIREMLANACDAIDKLKRKAFGNAQLTKEISEESRVTVSIDKAAGTITFADNGIGMTKDELREYLGTIAKSGTAETISRLKESQDAATLIGQFGVGFYSGYLIGDRIIVSSKSDDDPKQWVWIGSATSSDFTIVEDPRGATIRRGTEVTIKVRPEEGQFLDANEVLRHMKTYATYFPYPIYLQRTKMVEREVEAAAAEKPEKAAGEEESVEVQSDEEGEKGKEEQAKQTIKEEVLEDVHVNAQKPLWMRDPKTVSKEEYAQMYRTVFKANEDPLAVTQFVAEGDTTFRVILLIPKTAPFDVYSLKDAKPDVHLYVRRSFVTNTIADILPAPLSFVKCIVDSDDLPLNVSREFLQETPTLRAIKAKVLSKAIEMFLDMARDPERAEDFKKFWQVYSNHIKFEIARRENLRAKLAPVLRFESNTSDGKLVSFDEYVDSKPEGQKHILYLTGLSKAEVVKSPFMERPRAKGLQVLYAVDPIDEQTLKALHKYRDLPFQNIAQDGLKLDETDDEKAKRAERVKEFTPLSDWLKKHLAKDIDKVVISDRLVKSPFAIVASQFGLTGHMEKLMLSQRTGGKEDPLMSFFATQKKILEINPDHQTVKLLLEAVKQDVDNADLPNIVRALYDSAMLTSGFTLHYPRRFANSVERMAFKILGGSYDEPAEDNEEPEVKKGGFEYLLSPGAFDIPENEGVDNEEVEPQEDKDQPIEQEEQADEAEATEEVVEKEEL